MKKIVFTSLISIIFILSSCQTSLNSTVSKDKKNIETTDTTETFKGEPAYVAISDFSILTADKSLDFLSTEIPNDLAEGFAKGGLIKPVERQELEKVIAELKLSMTGLTNDDYSLQAGKLLGAKYMLFGSLSKIGEQIKINCRLVETETAQIIYTESSRGMYNDIFNVEDELTEKIEKFFKE